MLSVVDEAVVSVVTRASSHPVGSVTIFCAEPTLVETVGSVKNQIYINNQSFEHIGNEICEKLPDETIASANALFSSNFKASALNS